MKNLSKYLVIMVALVSFGLTVSTFDAQAVTKGPTTKVKVKKVSHRHLTIHNIAKTNKLQ